jgi:hypothetical protein
VITGLLIGGDARPLRNAGAGKTGARLKVWFGLAAAVCDGYRRAGFLLLPLYRALRRRVSARVVRRSPFALSRACCLAGSTSRASGITAWTHALYDVLVTVRRKMA